MSAVSNEDNNRSKTTSIEFKDLEKVLGEIKVPTTKKDVVLETLESLTGQKDGSGKYALFVVRYTAKVTIDAEKVGYIGISKKYPAFHIYEDAATALLAIKKSKVSYKSAFYLNGCHNVLLKEINDENSEHINLQLLPECVEMANFGYFSKDIAEKLKCLCTNYLKTRQLNQDENKENWFDLDLNDKKKQLQIAKNFFEKMMKLEENWMPINPYRIVHFYTDSKNELSFGSLNYELLNQEFLNKFFTADVMDEVSSDIDDFSKVTLNEPDLETNPLANYNIPNKKHVCSLSWLNILYKYTYCSHKIAEREDYQACHKSRVGCVLKYCKQNNDDHVTKIKNDFITKHDSIERLRKYTFQDIEEKINLADTEFLYFLNSLNLLKTNCDCEGKGIIVKKYSADLSHIILECGKCQKYPAILYKPLHGLDLKEDVDKKVCLEQANETREYEEIDEKFLKWNYIGRSKRHATKSVSERFNEHMDNIVLKTEKNKRYVIFTRDKVGPKEAFILRGLANVLKKDMSKSNQTPLDLSKFFHKATEMLNFGEFPFILIEHIEYCATVVFNCSALTHRLLTSTFLIDKRQWALQEKIYLLQDALVKKNYNDELKIILSSQKKIYEHILKFHRNGITSGISPRTNQKDKKNFNENIIKCYYLLSGNKQMEELFSELNKLFYEKHAELYEEMNVAACILKNVKPESTQNPKTRTIKEVKNVNKDSLVNNYVHYTPRMKFSDPVPLEEDSYLIKDNLFKAELKSIFK
uniref:Uncharacterized protein n=1 Tax=Panagrolaimus sp. PS1159 TaxID=55785 RepID=A0AC35F9B5_9BILA